LPNHVVAPSYIKLFNQTIAKSRGCSFLYKTA